MILHHKQLFRHDPDNGVYGDCFRTVIACLLQFPVEAVPHVCEGPEDGMADARMLDYLRDLGLVLIGVNFAGDVELPEILNTGAHYSQGLHWMLSGKSRTGCNHVVICKDAEIIHDTSLNNSGIVGPMSDGMWLIEWLVRPLEYGAARAA